MKRFTILAALIVSAAIPAYGQVAGYARGNDPAAASYTPDAAYAYNAAGSAIAITRRSAGIYTVTFAGLAPRVRGSSNVQVTPFGRGDATCRISHWGVVGNDFAVYVHCSADTQYSVLVTSGSSAPPRPPGVIRLPGKTSNETKPPRRIEGGGAAVETSDAQVIALTPPVPPARGAQKWLEERNDQLLAVIRAIASPEDVERYLTTEKGKNVYQQMAGRIEVLHGTAQAE